MRRVYEIYFRRCSNIYVHLTCVLERNSPANRVRAFVVMWISFLEVIVHRDVIESEPRSILLTSRYSSVQNTRTSIYTQLLSIFSLTLRCSVRQISSAPNSTNDLKYKIHRRSELIQKYTNPFQVWYFSDFQPKYSDISTVIIRKSAIVYGKKKRSKILFSNMQHLILVLLKITERFQRK